MKKFCEKDWVRRAAKTFVQSFLGVFLPEVVLVLNQGWPKGWGYLWAYLSPVVAAALAAAICAAWNIVLERLNEDGK